MAKYKSEGEITLYHKKPFLNCKASDEKGHYERINVKVPTKLEGKLISILNAKIFPEADSYHNLVRGILDWATNYIINNFTTGIESSDISLLKSACKRTIEAEHYESIYEFIDSTIKKLFKGKLSQDKKMVNFKEFVSELSVEHCAILKVVVEKEGYSEEILRIVRKNLRVV